MNLKDIERDERPREKLMRQGAEFLSETELIAALLGTGTKTASVMEVAAQLLTMDKSGIRFLAKCMPEELCSLSGVGFAKACQIAAAVEIGKRIAAKPQNGEYTVDGPQNAAAFVMEEMRYSNREVFKIIMLSSKGKVIAIEKIAEGGLNSAFVHPREIFSSPIRKNAHSVILVHNHPSGEPMPSEADIEVTERLIEAGELLGITVADHIIIGDGCYYSFKENKIL